VIFGIEGILAESEGVKDGKGKDEDKGKGEISIDQLLPTIMIRNWQNYWIQMQSKVHQEGWEFGFDSRSVLTEF